jgi:hypothetical protein
MKRTISKTALRFAMAALAFGASILPSQASLINFQDFGLGGTTAGWDTFYGANYLPAFSFDTGTAGNPITGSAGHLTLKAVNPGHIPGPPSPANGQATGPVDSDGATRPGNRDLFYTFFASTVNFSITGWVAAGQTLDDFAFQALVAPGSAGGISNIMLNGAAADDSGTAGGVGYWTWAGLNLDEGSQFTLSWQTTSQHSVLDAFQVQTDAGVVPEPSAYALLGLGLVALMVLKRRSSAALKG